MKKGLLFLYTSLILLLISSAADAKEGFYLGGQIPYNMVRGDFDDKTMSKVDPGAGIGLIAGYGITSGLSLEIDWAGSSHKSGSSTIGLGEFSLNGKYNFLAASKLQPFIFAGIGAFALGDDSLMFGGKGYNLGVGADYYLSPKVSLGVGLIQKFITYDSIEKSSAPFVLLKDLNGDTTSIRFDISYHF